MSWTRRSLMAAGAVGAVAPSLAWADADRQTLWEVRDGRAKVFLTGDGLSTTTPWRSPRIQAALHESAVFWRETPEPGPGDTAKLLAAGVDRAYPLSTHLSAEERDRVGVAAASVGSTYAFLEPLKPWLAAVALDQFDTQRPGFKAADGASTVLLGMAKADRKPVRSEFPDMDAVIGFFAAFSEQAQVQYLLLQVDDIEAGPDRGLHRAEAWAAGDLRPETREAWRIARAYPALYAELVVPRNRRWPRRIRAMLDGGGTTFVFVGATHLVGPDCVPDQLAAAGLAVRRT